MDLYSTYRLKTSNAVSDAEIYSDLVIKLLT